MPIYKVKLLDKHEVARGTIVFTFEKPAGFKFVAGQYAGFTLIDPVEIDAGGITRRFSLLNAPDDEHILVATRIQTSAYKRQLNSLAIGSEIKLAGPTGNFILHNDDHIPAVFIAGGIGITPFYSMLRHAAQHPSSQQLTLFYGNQSKQDTAFLDELLALKNQQANFNFIPTFNNPDADWTGEKGFVTHTMLKKYVPDLQTPIFYICGSPAMVTALQELLLEMGIAAEHIKVEDFPGY